MELVEARGDYAPPDYVIVPGECLNMFVLLRRLVETYGFVGDMEVHAIALKSAYREMLDGFYSHALATVQECGTASEYAEYNERGRFIGAAADVANRGSLSV